MSTEATEELLKQTKDRALKPTTKSALLGWKGRWPTLDELEAEDEDDDEEATQA